MPTQTSYTRLLPTAMFVLVALVASPATATAATPNIKVMTYNTHHGGTAATPATTDGELDTIAAQNPDVVVLQEAYVTQLSYYVNGLNARLGTNAWHGSYAKHCKAGTEPTCTTYRSETVMILTRLTTLAVIPRLIWAKDDYHVARATIRMSVALERRHAGERVRLPSPGAVKCPGRAHHLRQHVSDVGAVLRRTETGRRRFQRFARHDADRGDDAAVLRRVGARRLRTGYTHMHYPSLTATSRIDYWFSDKATPESFDGGQRRRRSHRFRSSRRGREPTPSPRSSRAAKRR